MTIISLRNTPKSNEGLIVLAAEHEGLRLESMYYGASPTLVKPLYRDGSVELPCGAKSCLRRLTLEASGSAIVQCAGYQTYSGQSFYGSGCDYRGYDEYEATPCSNQKDTLRLVERLAAISSYEVEEI
jgi:hypothetical protein